MKKSIILFLFILLCLSQLKCGYQSTNDSLTISNEARIDSIISQYELSQEPGIAIGIYQAGKIVFAKGYGLANLEHEIPFTPKTVFDIASNSKQFTAYAILLLEQQDRLSLDNQVKTYFPDIPIFETPIIIKHLIHNISGLRGYGDIREMIGKGIEHPTNRIEFIDFLRKQQSLNFEPGEQYSYSNTNWILLAMIVEQVSGRSFKDFMADEVFLPLGMSNTLVRDDPFEIIEGRSSTYTKLNNGFFRINHSWGLASNLSGMSFIHTTIEDLAKWDAHFYKENDKSFNVINRMYERGILNSGDTIHYARGLMIGEHKGYEMIFHGGFGGGSSQFTRFPNQQLTVAVFSNRYHTDLDTYELSLNIAELYLKDIESNEQIESKSNQQIKLGDAKRFANRYWIENDMRFTSFEVKNGRLVEVSEGEEYPLKMINDGKFQDDYELIEFSPKGTFGLGTHRSTGEKYDLVKAPLWQPSNEILTNLEGNYFSEELDYTWTIEVLNGQVFLQRSGLEDLKLEPAFENAFVCNNWLIRFKRDSNSMKLHVSSGRVKNLFFIQITD